MKMRFTFFLMLVAALPSVLYSAQKNKKKNKQQEQQAQIKQDFITPAVVSNIINPLVQEVTAVIPVDTFEQEIKTLVNNASQGTLPHAPSSTRLTSENSISSLDSFQHSHTQKEYSQTQSQSQSLSSSSTFGAWFDTVATKCKDTVWGHEANVLDDIKAGRLQCDTDGLHRIDRAIDGYIAAHSFKGIQDLLQICLEKQIMINLSHLDKAQAFIKQCEKELAITLTLICEQKKKIREKAASAEGTISHGNTEFIDNHL